VKKQKMVPKVGRSGERVIEALSSHGVMKKTSFRLFNINRHQEVGIAEFEIHFEMRGLFAFTQY